MRARQQAVGLALQQARARVQAGWRRGWSALPSRCAVCGVWPAAPAGWPVCSACVQRFEPLGTRCPRCAQVLPTANSPCPACGGQDRGLSACCALVDYDYPWQRLLQAFKFEGQPAWGGWWAERLWAHPPAAALLNQADWWVPVPMTARSLGQRGYNQAWVLAQALQRRRPMAMAPAGWTARPRSDLRLKLMDTPAQHGLNRRERLANLRHAFAVAPEREAEVRQRRVVLVDDIVTTGATLEAAALALRAAGASDVSAVVVACTPGPQTAEP